MCMMSGNKPRNKDMLGGFDKIRKLWTWLYADKDHRITVLNGIGASVELSMDPDGDVYARIMKSQVDPSAEPGEPYNYNEMLSVPVWLGIIGQLEKQPAEGPGSFKSRWEEIAFGAGVARALN